jgi:hypothetical protein
MPPPLQSGPLQTKITKRPQYNKTQKKMTPPQPSGPLQTKNQKEGFIAIILSTK